MTNYQLKKRRYHTEDYIRLASIWNENRLEIYFGELSLDTRYGVSVVTKGTHIMLIFIAESPKDLEMSSVYVRKLFKRR